MAPGGHPARSRAARGAQRDASICAPPEKSCRNGTGGGGSTRHSAPQTRQEPHTPTLLPQNPPPPTPYVPCTPRPAHHTHRPTPIAPHPPIPVGPPCPQVQPTPPVLFVTAVSLLPGDTRSTGGGGWHPRAEVPTGRGQRGLWGQWGIMGTVGDLGTYGDPRGDSGGAVVQWGQWSREVPTDAECPTGHGDPPGPPSSPPTLPCDPELQHSPPPPPKSKRPPRDTGTSSAPIGWGGCDPLSKLGSHGKVLGGSRKGGEGRGCLGSSKRGSRGSHRGGGITRGAGGELGVIPGQS